MSIDLCLSATTEAAATEAEPRKSEAEVMEAKAEVMEAKAAMEAKAVTDLFLLYIQSYRKLC